MKFKKTKCLFSENSRDNLEQMKKEIADIKEKLDILMNRLHLEEKKLKKEGKIYFFSRGEEDNWTAVVGLVRLRYHFVSSLSHGKLNGVNGIFLFRRTMS